MQSGQIFFSYSRTDGAFALKLGEDLKKAGIDIWIDQLDIRPSEPWDEEIERALQESQCMLVILSKTSVASDNVLNEINYAIESKKQVLPILVEKDVRKPLNIIRLQHIDFTKSYDKAYSQLLISLRSGQPVNPSTNKRSSRLIVPVSVVVALIFLAGIIIRTNSKRDDEAARLQKSAAMKAEAVNLNGIWTTEELTNPFDEHDKYTMSFNLDVSDTVLLGDISFKSTVPNKGYHFKTGFIGGSIKANNISFYTIEKNVGEDKTYKNYYNGILLKDSIKFTLQSDRPDGFPGMRFVAKKI